MQPGEYSSEARRVAPRQEPLAKGTPRVNIVEPAALARS